jgi:hypothetical protein
VRLCRYFRAGIAELRRLFLQMWSKSFPNSNWIGDSEQRLQLLALVKTKITSSLVLKKMRNEPMEAWDLPVWRNLLIAFHFRSPDLHSTVIDLSKLEHIVGVLISSRNEFSHARNDNDGRYATILESVGAVLLELGVDVSSLEKKTPIVVSNPYAVEAEMNLLKNHGNEAFAEFFFFLAVDLYSRALDVIGLSDDDRGVLYSNRSAAFYYIQEYRKSQEDAKNRLISFQDGSNLYIG